MKTISESIFYKAFITIILFFFSSQFILAQGFTYSWGHPSPQGNIVYGIAFKDVELGWAVTGCGNILETTDGGDSWVIIHEPDSLCRDLYDIAISGQGTILVSGDAGVIMRSTDEGESWETFSFPEAGRLYDLALVPGGGISAAGQNGTVLVSSDDGQNWSDKGPGGSGYARQHLWKSAAECYVVGKDLFHRTIDGGGTWTEVETPSFFGLNEVYFVNDEEGYTVEDFGYWKTTDGGNSWVFENNFNEPLYRFRTLALDENHWYAVAFGEGGELWETTDAGLSWTMHVNYYSVGFPSLTMNSNRLLFGSDLGDIFYTDDGGATVDNAVQNLAVFPSAPINTIGTRPDGTLFANNQPSGGTDNGTFFRSDDGGESWYSPADPPGLRWVYDIQFYDDQHGVLGSYGDVRYTSDGGESWGEASFPENYRLVNFALPQEDVYFAGTYSNSPAGGNLYRSEDQGATWTAVGGGLPLNNLYVSCVAFADVLTGYIACLVSNEPGMYRSTDGGQSWSMISLSGIPGFISDMLWLDANTGIAAVPNGDVGGIYRTTDGGLHWENVSQLRARQLTTRDGSYIGAVYPGDAMFQESTDEGMSWQIYSVPFSSSYPGYPGTVESIQATEDGYVVGGDGNRLMVAERDVSTGLEDRLENYREEHQSIAIFPNPVRDQAVIRLTLVAGGPVTLAVYDARGRQVQCVMHKTLAAGSYEVPLDVSGIRNSFGAGTYFITLKTSGRFETAKVIVLD